MPFLFLTASCFLEIFTVSVPTGLQVLGAGTAVARLPDKATPGLRVSNRHPFEGRSRNKQVLGATEMEYTAPKRAVVWAALPCSGKRDAMGEANGDGESAGGA